MSEDREEMHDCGLVVSSSTKALLRVSVLRLILSINRGGIVNSADLWRGVSVT